MTAEQLNIMNIELWQSIGAIADSEPLMERLTEYAKSLAKERIMEEKPIQTNLSSEPEYEHEPLTKLFQELKRLEAIDQEEEGKKRRRSLGLQRSGITVRVKNTCVLNDILTLGQLLKTGRKRFLQFRYIGRLSTDMISLAIKNLYGIEW